VLRSISANQKTGMARVKSALKQMVGSGVAKTFHYTLPDMHSLGEHCSVNERRADEATRDVTDWLKCEYMMDKVGESFDGIVTSVLGFGLFVELADIYVEGLVHITSLRNDFYHFDAAKHTLTGEHSHKSYRLGDSVRVKVARVDLDDKKIDFEMLDAGGGALSGERPGRGAKKGAKKDARKGPKRGAKASGNRAKGSSKRSSKPASTEPAAKKGTTQKKSTAAPPGATPATDGTKKKRRRRHKPKDKANQ
jgi:ribonuclease R